MGFISRLRARFARWMQVVNGGAARYWHHEAAKAELLDDDTRASADARENAYEAERAAERWRLTAERHAERSVS